MAMRIAIPQFQLANPLYKNASVAWYTVANGIPTSTLANLYADSFTANQLGNPQKLNSQGMNQQPIYVQDQVIGVVSGISVPSHTTGIVNPSSSVSGGGTVLAKLAGANLDTTADQPITNLPSKYRITEIVLTNATGSVTVAQGGVNLSPGGVSPIAPQQVLNSLTVPSSLLSLGFQSGALEAAYTAAQLYFACPVTQGVGMECDVYILGTPLT